MKQNYRRHDKDCPYPLGRCSAKCLFQSPKAAPEQARVLMLEALVKQARSVMDTVEQQSKVCAYCRAPMDSLGHHPGCAWKALLVSLREAEGKIDG